MQQNSPPSVEECSFVPASVAPVPVEVVSNSSNVDAAHMLLNCLPVIHVTMDFASERMLRPLCCPITGLLVRINSPILRGFEGIQEIPKACGSIKKEVMYSRVLRDRELKVYGTWFVYVNIWPHNIGKISFYGCYYINNAMEGPPYVGTTNMFKFNWPRMLVTLDKVASKLLSLSKPGRVPEFKWSFHSTTSWFDTFHRLGEVCVRERPKTLEEFHRVGENQCHITNIVKAVELNPLILIRGAMAVDDFGDIVELPDIVYRLPASIVSGAVEPLPFSFKVCNNVDIPESGIDYLVLHPRSSFRYDYQKPLIVNVAFDGKVTLSSTTSWKEVWEPKMGQLLFEKYEYKTVTSVPVAALFPYDVCEATHSLRMLKKRQFFECVD
jgi:hypothetical protein